MNAKEISLRLADRAEQFVRTLYPDAAKRGKDLKLGNVRGDKGDSMTISLSGSHKGRWKDFATNEGGDLIDLLMAARGCDMNEALKQAKQYLGVSEVHEIPAAKRTYTKPERPAVVAPSAVAQWLAARGVSEETVRQFKVGERSEGDRTYAVLPFFVDGAIVNFKWRNIAEKRDMRQSKDPQPSLFGWHLIDPRCRSVVITEGEIDAMAVHQCGFAALSVPAGAGNHQWIEVDWDRLNRFSEIVLWYDNDEPGKKGAAEVAKRLGLERVRLVSCPHKDANDALLACADDVIEAVTTARYIAPEDLKCATDYIEELIEYFSPDAQDVTGSPLWIGEHLPFVRFRPGEVSVWTGINGHGKSAFLGMQAARWSMNDDAVAVFSGEMTPKQTLGRMVRQIAGCKHPSPTQIRAAATGMGERMWLVDVIGNCGIERILDLFSYSARRHGVKQFIIDSIMMTDIPEDGRGALDAQRAAMQRLVAFSQAYDCHVHVVAHPRKTESEANAPGKLDVAGSRVITGMAHNVMTVWADLKKSDTSSGTFDGKFILQKQRNGDIQYREIGFFYEPDSLRYYINAGFDLNDPWCRS